MTRSAKSNAWAVVKEGILPTDLSPLHHAFDSSDGFVLPTQTGQSRWLPEQDLIREMLMNAVLEAREHEEPGQPRDKAYHRFVNQRHALAWIFTPGEHPFSFEWSCIHTGIDAEKLRSYLRTRIPRAAEIEEHVLDPVHVPAPAIPAELLPPTRMMRASYRTEVLL